MQEALSRGATAAERFRLAGKVHSRFVQKNVDPPHVLFDLAFPEKAPASSGKTARRAFQTLVDGVRSLQAEGTIPPGDAMAPALAARSMVHGLAKLAASGLVRLGATTILEFVSHLTAVIGSGLARVSPSMPPAGLPARSGGKRRAP